MDRRIKDIILGIILLIDSAIFAIVSGCLLSHAASALHDPDGIISLIVLLPMSLSGSIYQMICGWRLVFGKGL